MKFVVIAFAAAALVACQHAPKSEPLAMPTPPPMPEAVHIVVPEGEKAPEVPGPRKPASLSLAAENARVFNGATFEVTQDVDLRNESLYTKMIDWAGAEILVTEATKIRCAFHATVAARSMSVLKAGVPYSLAWVPGDETVIGVFREFDKPYADTEPRAFINCQSLEVGNFSPPAENVDQMRLTGALLEKALPIKILDKGVAPEIKVEPIKYSPGDEKILKEYSI